ncbi:MAG TPA: energy transducer TonB [Terracidiphilus sp.]|nr:energy transducer TonB [Terracidiphilus sp.]
MSGRAEMSTTIHDREPADAGSGRMAIALIGPNNSHRKTVAKALAGTGAKSVREFDDYPATLADVPRLMEQGFDVVMIDVDSDQSYAMALIESIAHIGKTVVIAYSQRNDQNLLMSCMQAGARELLPLPDDNDPDRRSPVPSNGAKSKPVPVEEPMRIEESPIPESAVVQHGNPNGQEHLRPKEASAAEAAPTPVDYNEWDSLHLRPARPGNKNPETGPHLAVSTKPIQTPQVKERERSGKEKKEPLRITPVGAPVAERPLQESAHPAAAVEPPKQPIRVMAKVDAPAPRKEPQPAPEPQKRESATKHAETAVKDEIQDKRAWDKLWARTAPSPDVSAPNATPGTEEPAVTGDENWENVWARTTAPAVPKAVEETAQLEPAPEPAQLPDLWLDAIEAESQSRAANRVKTIEVPVFRYVEPEEGRKERHGSHLVILAMGFGVLVCLCWIYFMHPFGQKMPAVETHLPATVAAQPKVEAATISAPAAKPPADGAPLAPADGVGPRPAGRTEAVPPAPAVSSDEMNAQLAAPSRISGQIKRPVVPDEPPPSAVATGAMETNGAVPGGVFGEQKHVKVVITQQRISDGVAAGMLLHKTAPIYPEFAKQGHVTGTVVLGATISKTGTIQDIHYISGPEILRNAAMDAVKTWRYRPYMLDSQPVAVDTTIKLVFSLDHQ